MTDVRVLFTPCSGMFAPLPFKRGKNVNGLAKPKHTHIPGGGVGWLTENTPTHGFDRGVVISNWLGFNYGNC